LDAKKYTDVRMHRVIPPQELHDMNASSKMNASWEFFQMLHALGRAQMDVWLATNKSALGKHQTLDIKEHFLVKHQPSTSIKKTIP
jgi:NTE family protein